MISDGGFHMSKKMKTIGERLQENEEIIKELLAEGMSERQARKQLVYRALEKWALKQMMEGNSRDTPAKEKKLISKRG